MHVVGPGARWLWLWTTILGFMTSPGLWPYMWLSNISISDSVLTALFSTRPARTACYRNGHRSVNTLAALHTRQCSYARPQCWVRRNYGRLRLPANIIFFFWLAIQGRWWTSERLHRHELHDNGLCALCSQDAEASNHLLLGCVFAW
jgi:hypothetical protein